jgi:hypothetical protein
MSCDRPDEASSPKGAILARWSCPVLLAPRLPDSKFSKFLGAGTDRSDRRRSPSETAGVHCPPDYAASECGDRDRFYNCYNSLGCEMRPFHGGCVRNVSIAIPRKNKGPRKKILGLMCKRRTTDALFLVRALTGPQDTATRKTLRRKSRAAETPLQYESFGVYLREYFYTRISN